MSSEVEAKTGMMSSLRKLLGGDDPELRELETGAGNDEATLVLTGDSAEARGDGAPASPHGAISTGAEDGDALVLGPALRTQALDDTAALETEPADVATDGYASGVAQSAMFDIGLEEVGPSSVEFNDNLEVDRPAEDGAGDDPRDFDPAVWGPVLSEVREGVDAGDAGVAAAVPDVDPREAAAADLTAQLDDNKLKETPVSDQSEDDKVSGTVSDAGGGGQDEAPDEQSAEAPDEAVADAPEDFQELLEDTIRRILREELTGDMGQRLSQNIQKMIREQVAQAIPARD